MGGPDDVFRSPSSSRSLLLLLQVSAFVLFSVSIANTVSKTIDFVMSAKTLTKKAGPDDVLLGRKAVTKTTEKLWIGSNNDQALNFCLNI